MALAVKQSPEWNAQWQVDRVLPALKKALIDQSVDVVYAAGLLISNAAANKDLVLTKPVVAGVAVDSELNGLAANAQGFSPKANFAFICLPGIVREDIKAFHRLVGFDSLHVLVDRFTAAAANKTASVITKMEQEMGIAIKLISVNESATPVLSALTDAKAVYLTLFPRLNDTQWRLLVDGIHERKIPSFSLLGRQAVENGVMAGRLPAIENSIRRRIALNIHQILNGFPADQINVHLVIPPRLLLNMETAQKIGFEPGLIALIEDVEWVGQRQIMSGTVLTLEQAMEMAARQNIDMAIALNQLESMQADQQHAKSGFFPQIYGTSQYRQIDEDRAAWALGNSPEHLTTLSASLRQTIYDDGILTRYRTSRLKCDAAELSMASVRLDRMEEVGKRFLQCLSALALFQIEKDNLTVTQKNLRLARIRRQVGTAGPEEIYRWEAEEAHRKGSVISAFQSIEIAFVALDQSLGTDQTQRWQLKNITVNNDDSYFLNNRFHLIVKNMADLSTLTRFSYQLAIENSPEIQRLDKALDAAHLEQAFLKRRYYVPVMSAGAGYTYRADEAGKGVDSDLGFILPGFPSLDNHEWHLALNLTLPFYEGGGRAADLRQNQSAIAQLENQKRKICQLLEQRVRMAIYNISKSWPNIFLTRTAAEQAKKNLDLVQNLYAQGKLNITDLISAQNHRLLQEQNAALIVYQYLTDLVAYQRAIGWFEWEHPPLEKDRLFNRLSVASKAAPCHGERK